MIIIQKSDTEMLREIQEAIKAVAENKWGAKGRDPYKDFASKIYNVPYDSVSKKQRNLMKPCVLGRQYGIFRITNQ